MMNFTALAEISIRIMGVRNDVKIEMEGRKEFFGYVCGRNARMARIAIAI